MSEKKRILKSIRISPQTNNKLEQIKEKLNNSSEYILTSSTATDRTIIEDAIDLYHQHVIGVDVVTPSSEKIVDRVGNIVEMQLSSFSKTMANYFNAMLLNEETILSMLPILLDLHDFDFGRIAEGDDMGLKDKMTFYKPLVNLLQEAVAEQENNN